ncbi:MFS transporter [Inhella sp.]|uniref:MFS transporter n=1 Tax=Inhella sp. TaxID=1921806 RepID=UPI0035AE3584
MRLPNLLASRHGRLLAFFLLYVTEGIPLGFAATAVATQLRRYGVGPAEIGAFVASFYLPWAFKWAFGPMVDVFRSTRFGHRRAWILGTQLMMALTLLALMAVPLPTGLGLFTAILLVHNAFGALQDVAIDSLACTTLQPEERGLGNGLMFAGAALGTALGGSGVLFLSGWTGFSFTFVFVAAAILAVTAGVVWPMREAPGLLDAPPPAGWRSAGREMQRFAGDAFRAFLGTRGAFAALGFALLPVGAMALGLALQSNLAVELGMDDTQIGWLSLATQVVMAAFMVLGGYLGDRLGRRGTLAVYILGMAPPTLYLAWALQQAGYIWPSATPSPQPALQLALWIASMGYSVFQGLMYGTRAALFMDVTNPRLAATQFTAYMALMNLAIAFSSNWLGLATELLGYPVTLMLDALTGLLCLALLPALRAQPGLVHDGRAEPRARRCALALGLLCLAWLPCSLQMPQFGKAQPLLHTVFTLVFVASALFLLAGRAELGRARRLVVWLAPLLLALPARRWLPEMDAAWPVEALRALSLGVPMAAGLLLLGLGVRSWQGLAPQAA